MFVSFEGIDGSGKSTAARNLATSLRRVDLPVRLISRRTPEVQDQYARQHAKGLAALLWPQAPNEPQYKMGDEYFLHLTAAWLRLIDRHVVIPALECGSIVIIDGWYYKAAARHRIRTHVPRSLIEEAFRGLSSPRVIFYIDIAPEIAATRKDNFSNAECGINDGLKGGLSSFIEYQSHVDALMREMCNGASLSRFIDGRVSPEQLTSIAHSHLMEIALNRAGNIRLVDQDDLVSQNVNRS